ncbi:class I SAM-dependent methyltransferase [bacterium]|nr:class I SAM-dependent methyltransferase [bacterium]MBU1615430.1 class I SAM-dependent methyltransferase [bacterium]
MKNIQCNLCGIDSPEILFYGQDRMFDLEGEFRVVKCTNCGLIYLNPQPEPEELSRHYPENYEPYNPKENPIVRWVKKEIVKSDIRRIHKLIGERGEILEIGCASGEYLTALRDIGEFKVKGVELNSYAATKAKEKGLDVFVGTLEEAKLKAESFDLVVARHVLEHLPDPSKTLSEINRILRPGGKFLAIVPNAATFERAIFKDVWCGYEVPRHLFVFSCVTLKEMFKKADFKLLSLKHGFVPNNWIISLNHLFKKRGFKKRAVNFFNIDNILLLSLFTPLSLLIGFLKRSGRISGIARKD